jgi:3-phenylpropionate/cinnamic acid dioxygenase small subunit
VLELSDPATTHKLAINDLLSRFFQAFDAKDWPAMRECLCDQVFTDSSSFRQVPSATIWADTFVDQRRIALQALEMQHNFLNLRVELDADGGAATARCNYVIHRFHRAMESIDDDYFHSYGHYVFGFVNECGTWKIAGITQTVVRNVGNLEIHGALRTS